MTRIKRLIISALAALGLFAPALVPAVAHAQAGSTDQAITSGLNCGAELSFQIGGTCEAGNTEIGGTLDNIFIQIINVISIIVAVAAVIMIIIGGFRYITSNGDSGAVSGAKNTILYAIIGLAIVALAQIIVRFVVQQLNAATNGTGGAAAGGADGGVQ